MAPTGPAVGRIICAGTAAGELRFLDGQLRLRQWYQRFGLAAVRCLSAGLQAVWPVRREPTDPDTPPSTAGDGGIPQPDAKSPQVKL